MSECITEARLNSAVQFLVEREPRFGAIVRRHGIPPLRLVPPGLESLLRIVTDQLISLKAGQAIWARLEQRLAPFDPHDILELDERELKGLGLSGAKARTFLAAAKAALGGTFDQPAHAAVADAQIIDRLRQIPGVGPWTANIYLLTALGRMDAWPSEDLALQVAMQDLLGLDSRPGPKHMSQLSEAWKPCRSVSARLLWSHYRGLKGLPQRTM